MPITTIYTQLPRQIQGRILMLFKAQNSHLESMRVVHKKSMERFDPFHVEQSMVQIALPLLSTEDKLHTFFLAVTFCYHALWNVFFYPTVYN